MAQAPEAGGQARGQPVDPSGDGAQALGSVVDRIHAGHDGEKHLGGADIAGRFVPANMLFPGLDGQPVGGLAVAVA